jgi:hypothetical protein
MSWVRRHPFAAAIFGIIFLFFVFAAIVGGDDGERTDAILGLILIYLLLVGGYAFVAWLVRVIRGKPDHLPRLPVPPMPYGAQQQFPQWDWSARTAMPTPCRNCGASNPPGSAFCDQCGARLENVAPPPTPGYATPGDATPNFAPPPSAGPPNFAPMPPPVGAVECPRCHTRLSPQVRFCTNCGLPRNSPPVASR